MESLFTEAKWAIYGLGYVAVALTFLLTAKVVYSWFVPYSLKKELAQVDNPAVGIVFSGYLVGVICVICGTLAGAGFNASESPHFLLELPILIFYGTLGVILLILTGFVNNRLILKDFFSYKSLVESSNKSIGVIAASVYLSTGLIIAGGIHGSMDPVSVLVSHVIGQSALLVFSVFYQWVTKYNEKIEIGEKRNLAAGFSFGGNLIAYSLILMKAVSATDVVFWEYRLRYFGYYALLGGLLLVLLHIINERIILPEVKLSDEIVNDQNINAGLLDAVTSIGAAAILIFSL